MTEAPQDHHDLIGIIGRKTTINIGSADDIDETSKWQTHCQGPWDRLGKATSVYDGM